MKKKILLIVCCLSAGLVGMAAAILPVGYFLGLIPPSKAMVVLSGSMAPELKVGSLAIVAKADNYLTNDVISFSPSGDLKKDIVTHRIVAKEFPEGIEKSPIFLTAGDANKSFDFKKLKQEQIIGKVIFSVPYLGYIANFFKEPYGFILFFVVPVTIIVYEELKTLKKELANELKKLKESRVNSRALIFIPVMAAALALTSYSRSFFSDKETSSNNSFQAGAWTAPPNLAGHLVISEVQVAGGTADDEFIELYNPTASEVDISSWSIQYRGGDGTSYVRKNFGAGQTIPAHGFFLITKGGSGGYDGVVAFDMTQSTFSLSATGGTVFLVNDQVELAEGTDGGPTVVDKLAYGTGTLRPEGTTYTPVSDANQSIERKAYSTSDTLSMMTGTDVTKGNAYDSENNASDFILRTTSQPQNSSSSLEIP